jgi:hypothetical protein
MTLYTIVTIHVAVITAMLCVYVSASGYQTRLHARLVAAAGVMLMLAQLV